MRRQYQGRPAPPGHKSAAITLHRYGRLFPEELDRLADRLDRLHAQAAVYPAWTDAAVAPSENAKRQVRDLPLVVEVGRLELPGLVIRTYRPHAAPTAESRF